MLGMAFAMVFACARPPRGERDETTGPLVAALGGALAASVVHALTIEVLHFRHFWMLLAIICAVDAQVRRRAEKDAPAEHPGPSSAMGVAAA
jgi:hypothetical protein